jgi:hypothetical protein
VDDKTGPDKKKPDVVISEADECLYTSDYFKNTD